MTKEDKKHAFFEFLSFYLISFSGGVGLFFISFMAGHPLILNLFLGISMSVLASFILSDYKIYNWR